MPLPDCCHPWPDELEESIAAEIEALDVSAHAYRSVSTLRRSKVPLDPASDSRSLGHLLFTVDVVDIEGDPVHGGEEQTWEVDIRLGYKLRRDAQIKDFGALKRLCVEILKTLIPGCLHNRRTREKVVERVKVGKEAWGFATLTLDVGPMLVVSP